MRKLIILPSWCESLGGMTVSLSITIRGFEQLGLGEQLCVLVKSDSLMENYLQQLGQGSCLQVIKAPKHHQFFQLAFRWVAEQNRHWPLLLENCSSRYLLPTLALAAPGLRFSGRPIYHVFRDLAYSYNPLGNLFRKFIFTYLAPGAICNSHFTARSIAKNLIPNIQGVLYPPVDRKRFSPRLRLGSPPSGLQPILDSGAKIMLTPSRISQPRHVNDKNLRGLILVLAKLKELGHHYHGVIIGEDYSPDKLQTRALMELAEMLMVSDRLTILPPSFSIEDYYQYADMVVTLSPREPFGRTVVEAIACGVPVVGSNTGGIGEILGNFAPQWTVDPYEPMAVAQTIIRLVSDPNTSSLLTQGQKWVESHCSPLEYAKKMIEIVNLNSSTTIQEQPISTLAAK